MLKSFTGGAKPTTLQIGVNEVALSLTGTAFAGWPDGSQGPINVTLDRDLPDEEKILVASIAGTVMTVAQRGYDGTVGKAHSAGCTIEHGWFGIDASQSNTHVNSATGVHGLGGADGSLVGATKVQTLTGKSISGDTNTLTNIHPVSLPETTAEIAGLHNVDTTLQASIAAETTNRTNADAAHVAALDPHAQYLTSAEGNAAYEVIGAASAAVAVHVAAVDPHPQYLTPAEETALNRVTGSAAAKKLDGGAVTRAMPAVPVANGAIIQPVVFPVGLFTSPPKVVCSMASAPGGSGIFTTRAINITATGCDIYAYNVGIATSPASLTIVADWIAVGV